MIKRKGDIGKINKSTTKIHIYHYLTKPMLSKILKRKPDTEEIYINSSTKIPSRTRIQLKKLNIRIIEASFLGRPPIYPKTFVEMLRQDHINGKRPIDLAREHNIPFSSIQYLLFERKTFREDML